MFSGVPLCVAHPLIIAGIVHASVSIPTFKKVIIPFFAIVVDGSIQ